MIEEEEKSLRRQYSSIGHMLMAGADRPSDDPLIKKIFSNREVLACLLKEFIVEYQGLTQEEIRLRFLPSASLSFGTEPVHDGDISPDGVPAANTEDKSLREGTTAYDVLLRLPVPQDTGKSIGVIVNIEVQNDTNPGYKLERRMLYYLCRLISGQREMCFRGSDYDSICKAYSLWLCPRLADGSEPSIDCYTVNGVRKYGSGGPDAAKRDYDIIEGICCKFNKKELKKGNRLLRYLQLLLTDTAPPAKRLNELNENYGISKTQEIEEMGNYTLFLIDEYTRQGMEKGMEKKALECLANLQKNHASKEMIMNILNVDKAELAELCKKLQKHK